MDSVICFFQAIIRMSSKSTSLQWTLTHGSSLLGYEPWISCVRECSRTQKIRAAKKVGAWLTIYSWLLLELALTHAQGNFLWNFIIGSPCLLFSHREILPHSLLFGIFDTMDNLKFLLVSLNLSLIHELSLQTYRIQLYN